MMDLYEAIDILEEYLTFYCDGIPDEAVLDAMKICLEAAREAAKSEEAESVEVKDI